MTNQGVDQKPSETALFAALRRTIAHKEYRNDRFGPDHLAEYFLPPHFRFFLKFKKVQLNTKERLNGFLPGLNEYMIARTAYFDRLFVDALREGTHQIVLLGAGYDSRAYRFAESKQGTRIFELDSAPTQDRKKKCLKKARINVPPSMALAPIDFNTQSLKDVLEKAGYDHSQKTLFIWEGVSYYLEADSVDSTLAFVRSNTHPGTTIAFDYTISISSEKILDYYGVREFEQTMKEHHANEALLFSLRDGEADSFLEGRGLKIVEHFDNTEIEQRYLTDDDGTPIGRMTGHFRFVLASK
jgi:methyltransferase (TIGR00027 family)